MKAIIVKQPGGTEQLQLAEQSKPKIKPDELLVKVKASGVNRTDIVNRSSKSSYLNSSILGVEVAGIVEESGSKTDVKVGTQVMGLVNGGGYAEYAVIPAERAMVIPENLSFIEAAAIPEVFLTAYQTLFWLGELRQKETVLIHAGGSGVGTAAIQLAKQIMNASILTTAGSTEKLDVCQSLGADTIINYKQQEFDEEVLRVTNNQGADVILDFVGSSYFKKNLTSLKLDGRWILIGLLGGAHVKNINLMEIMAKRVQLKGTLLTPRTDKYKADLTKDFVKHALPLFSQGKIKPIIDQVFPINQVQQAHIRMEKNQNIGKIILSFE